MKRKIKNILSLFLLFLFPLALQAQDSLMVKAGKYYDSKEYDKAIELYQGILKNKQESAEIYYNLGNAYYKSGKFTQSIIQYERAKLLAPNDDDIQFNLTLANRYVVDAIDEIPQVFFIRWYHNFKNKFSSDGWAHISTISFILMMIMAGIFFLSRTTGIKKSSFWIGILMLLTTLLSFNFASSQKNKIEGHNFAIITQPSITIKSSPSDGGTDLFLIHEGLKVQIKDSLDTWYEIKIADGNQGWLPKKSLEKI